MFLYAPAGGHNSIWSLRLGNKKYNACIIYQTQSICLNAIGRHTELQLALMNVDAKNQATTRAAELDLEPSVVRWSYPVCSGFRLLRSSCLFLSLHLIFTGCYHTINTPIRTE